MPEKTFGGGCVERKIKVRIFCVFDHISKSKKKKKKKERKVNKCL